jgi:hypothetical protein
MANRFAKSHATDTNQPEIIAALEKIGCFVHEIERPLDLLVEYHKIFILLEVKNRGGKNKLTDDQKIFFMDTKGPAFVVHDSEEAIKRVQSVWKNTWKPVVVK